MTASVVWLQLHECDRRTDGRTDTGPRLSLRLHTALAVGCHYFLSGQRLPAQSPSITAHWPAPNYTAWYVTEARVCKQLIQGCTQQWGGLDWNSRPVDLKSCSLLTTRPLSHPQRYCYSIFIIVHEICLSVAVYSGSDVNMQGQGQGLTSLYILGG